jgi:guanylate kinase
VRSDFPDVWVSVSVTTRQPRPGEVDGVDYVFIDYAEFDRLIADGDLLEWAEVHGAARYGTRRSAVEEHLSAGHPVLLEIDLQGARQVREHMPEALLVFLAPPNREELERRLLGRGTEDPEERVRRLQTAEIEMAAMDEFDVTIVNDDVATAAGELVDLLRFGTSADSRSHN